MGAARAAMLAPTSANANAAASVAALGVCGWPQQISRTRGLVLQVYLAWLASGWPTWMEPSITEMPLVMKKSKV